MSEKGVNRGAGVKAGNSRSFHSKISGTSHKNSDGSDRQDYIKRYVKAGDDLVLAPEPYNPVSPAAIALFVLRETGTLRKSREALQLGYVAGELAPEIHRMWADGKRVRVAVSEVTGGTRDKPSRGVNLLFEVVEE